MEGDDVRSNLAFILLSLIVYELYLLNGVLIEKVSGMLAIQNPLLLKFMLEY